MSARSGVQSVPGRFSTNGPANGCLGGDQWGWLCHRVIGRYARTPPQPVELEIHYGHGRGTAENESGIRHEGHRCSSAVGLGLRPPEKVLKNNCIMKYL